MLRVSLQRIRCNEKMKYSETRYTRNVSTHTSYESNMWYSLEIVYDTMFGLRFYTRYRYNGISSMHCDKIKIFGVPTIDEFYTHLKEGFVDDYALTVDKKAYDNKNIYFSDKITNLLECAKQERLYERYLNQQIVRVSTNFII